MMKLGIKKKKLRQLRKRKILSRNERVMGAIRDGEVICTDKRLIFYKPKRLGRWESESLPLEHISYVMFKKSIFSSEIVIKTGTDERKVTSLSAKVGVTMQEIISNQIIIVKTSISGGTIPDPNPLMELQLMFVHGEVAEDEYLRRMMIL